MGQIQGVRTAGGDVKLIKDVGEYDVWSSAVFNSVQQADLYIFSYSLGGAVAGAPAVTATKAETNLNVANAFVDESMNVYGIALQIARVTPMAFEPGAITDYTSWLGDWFEIEAKSHFGFYIGGDKPFAEGKITWFGEAGGRWGFSPLVGSMLANNVPTPASARVWKYTLPIGRIEKFWGRFEFPRGPLAIGAGVGSPAAGLGNVQVLCRLLGVRTRGVQ